MAEWLGLGEGEGRGYGKEIRMLGRMLGRLW